MRLANLEKFLFKNDKRGFQHVKNEKKQKNIRLKSIF